MKRFAILAVLTVLLVNLLTIESRSAVAADRFVSLEGRFSISLQDSFKQRTRLTIPTPVGDAYGPLYEWQTKDWTFGVGYADTFKPITDPEAVKQLFAGVTESFRKLVVTAGGENAVVKEITLGKHPGIEQHADLNKRSFIQRTYLASRRIYQTLVVVTNRDRHERTAIEVLDSFKILNDAEITEEALKAGPGPLPQTPETPRAGSDADDEGLRGSVKSVRTEVQHPSETVLTRSQPRFWITTYNEKGNKVRTEEYDYKNNLSLIRVYGYLDGARVSASKFIQREYGPPIGSGGAGRRSNKPGDPRYDLRFEFKYDEKKRLIEETQFFSNGDISWRHVHKYEGNQKETLLYVEGGSLTSRRVAVLDDKGNPLEVTYFEPDGTIYSKISYSYEFDSNGNWIKRTTTRDERREKLRRLVPATSVDLRTITYN